MRFVLLKKHLVVLLLGLSVLLFTMSSNTQAIVKNNPGTEDGINDYYGLIDNIDDQIITFSEDTITYEVHVPQYVNVELLNLNLGDNVEVTGYLKVTSCKNIIYPTMINGIVLEDLKPLDGSGKS